MSRPADQSTESFATDSLESAVPDGASWLHAPERGSRWGMAFLFRALRLLGRRPVHWIMMLFVVPYFVLGSRKAFSDSNSYWRKMERCLGEPRRNRWSSFWQVARHFYRFAQVTLDRVRLAAGSGTGWAPTRGLNIERQGSELLAEAAKSGKGALLLGAHLGSFEMMRTMADLERVPVTVLAHQENARRIGEFLHQVSGGRSNLRVLEIDPGNPAYIFRVQERVEAGDLIAIMGDRVGLGEAGRVQRVEFLGEPANFPLGPYLLASVLHCPVFLVFGLFEAPKRYRLFCEPFAEEVVLPRGKREEALRQYVQRYAKRLEHYCKMAPDNWFNFFDFWASSNVHKSSVTKTAGAQALATQRTD